MPQPTSIAAVEGRRYRQEIGDALIASFVDLRSNDVLQRRDGSKTYIPTFRSALQSSGGREAFAPTAADDGTVTIFLEAVPSPDIAARVAGAAPAAPSTQFALVLNASGGGPRFPLAHKSEGGAISRLTVKLSAADLKSARAALFDSNPNVAIEVTQSLRIAAQQTKEFVQTNWANNSVRQGLLDLFQIPFDSAATFFSMATQADSDFTNEFMLLDCVYKTQVAAPPLPGYLQIQVNWQNRAYNYYQDNQEPTRIFFLPDRFEFAKGPAGAPAVSLLQFSLPDGEASVDRTLATFRLFGNPVVDFNRINDAAQQLRGRAGGAPQMTSLQDAHHAKMTFTQYLPNAQNTSSDPSAQKNANVDLAAGLRNELNLNFVQFRALWAAIFSADPQNPLFRGWVDVELSDGKFKDRIDFNGRLPKDRETPFFDDIIDTSAQSTYPAQFTVKSVKSLFEGDAALDSVEITFSGGKVVTLSADHLAETVKIERSIRDIVLGNQSPDEYPYKMHVVRADGTENCCEGKQKSDNPNLFVLRDLLAKCLGKCQ